MLAGYLCATLSAGDELCMGVLGAGPQGGGRLFARVISCAIQRRLR